jgi:hypothetical protein
MLNINVMDERGFSFQIDLVRFFKANESNYLMYTLNEIDENDYIKLYAAKMIDDNSFARIEEENEWLNVKELIKLIVKEAKGGAVTSVIDLNEKRIEGIRILSTRAFKLNKEVRETLSMNRPEFVEEMPSLEEAIVTEKTELEEVTKVEEPKSEEVPSYLEEPKEEELKEEFNLSFDNSDAEETPSIEGFKALFGNETFNFDLPSEPESTEPQKVSSLDELLGSPTYSYEGEESSLEEALVEEPKFSPLVESREKELESQVESLTLKIKEYEETLEKLRELLK